MKQFLFWLAPGVLLLTGCRKGEPEAPPALTGDYLMGDVVVTAPIVMYTRGGPITNPGLIDRFLSRRNLTPSAFSRTDVPVPPTARFALRIEANQQARWFVPAPGGRDTVLLDVMSQRPNYVVLARRDSATDGSSSSTLVYTPSRCETFGAQMEVENPVKRCRTTYSSAGIAIRCRFRPLFLLKITAGQLSVPQLSWSLSANLGGSGCGSGANNVWNLFNPGVVAQLTAGDTVVVQERSIALVKK